MKLVLATPLFPPDLGGPATYAKLLCEHLPDAGVEVRLVNFADVRHLPKVIRHISYFFRVFRAGKGADVVLALDPVSVGLPALCAARILGKPFVVKIVGDFAWEQGRQRFGVAESLDEFVRKERVPFGAACLRVVQTYVAKNATRIIVPSEYLKGIIMAWSHVLKKSPEKISVIYNSAETETFDASAGDESSEKVSRMPHEIISVGRLVPWKGVDSLIRAFAEILKKIPDASLVIVGEGPEKASLQKITHDLALEEKVFFTGALIHAETMQAMQSAEVFVLNSTYEGLSHTVIEALSLGSAIVVSDAGGNPELVQNEINGLVIPAPRTENSTENSAALAAAITRLMQDAELRAKLGTAAKKSAMRFTVYAMIEKTIALLESARSADTLPKNSHE
jgi:glycosyltransferase involved in cell wall biosynthesis